MLLEINIPLTRLFVLLRVDLSRQGRGKVPTLAAITSPLAGEMDATAQRLGGVAAGGGSLRKHSPPLR